MILALYYTAEVLGLWPRIWGHYFKRGCIAKPAAQFGNGKSKWPAYLDGMSEIQLLKNDF